MERGIDRIRTRLGDMSYALRREDGRGSLTSGHSSNALFFQFCHLDL